MELSQGLSIDQYYDICAAIRADGKQVVTSIFREIANMKKKSSINADETIVLDGQGDAAIVSVEDSVGVTVEEEKVSIVSQAVYKTVYAVSFGVVFSSLLVSKLLVPKNSIIAKALHDGTVAAQKAVEEKELLFAEVAEQTTEILSGEEPSAVAL
jgi:hypothetical protein